MMAADGQLALSIPLDDGTDQFSIRLRGDVTGRIIRTRRDPM